MEQNKKQIGIGYKIFAVFILIYVLLAIYVFSIPLNDLESFGPLLFINTPLGFILALVSFSIQIRNLNAIKFQKIISAMGIIIGLLIPFLSIIRFLIKTE